MNFKDLSSGALQVLKTVAPTILATAAGPFSPLVAPILAGIFGTKAGDAKGLDTAILNATPDQILAARKAETDHIEKLKEYGIQEEQLGYNDLASARQMQVATKDPIVHQLAWLNVGGFLVIAAFLIVAAVLAPEQVSKVPATAWATLGTVFGYLAKSASQTEAFFFGSSAGSQAKDATIADIAKAP